MCLLSAITGVWLRGMDNNILTQIGFVVLVALACKNALLIVEFAKEQQQEGKDRIAAAIDACRIRLRPILMTSFAFILGVLPLFVATGAGAEMLRALGTSVRSGMVGVTCFGLLLTPVFYVVIRWCVERRHEKPEPSSNHVGTLVAIALVPCLLLLSGCMLVRPDYKTPPLPVPAGFANQAQASLSTDTVETASWPGFQDAERTLLEAQDQLANSETRTATALVAVYKALGGRWEIAPEMASSKAL